MNLKKIKNKIRYRPLGSLKQYMRMICYRYISVAGRLAFLGLYKFGIIKSRAFNKENIKKILIIRPDRVGDVVLATPTFRAVRENFPLAYIAVLIDDKTRDLIFDNPYIDEIFTIKQAGLTGLFRNSGLIRKLIDKRFDLAIILYPVLWCNFLTVICRIPYRLGYALEESGFLLNLKPAERYEEMTEHEVEKNLNLLRQIGIEPLRGELAVSIRDDAEEKINKFLMQKKILAKDKIIIIHVGAHHKWRRWLKEGFARVGDHLISNYKVKVIIMGGPGEEDLVKQVGSLMEKEPVMVSGLTLSEAVSLIKRASLFIGHSTGPMHIAAALKVPVVAIFGSAYFLDSSRIWAPYGTDNIIIHKNIGCIDCEPESCRRYRCMEAVSADDVITAAAKLLRKELVRQDNLCAEFAE